MKKLLTITLLFSVLFSTAQNDLNREQVRDSIDALAATVTLTQLKTVMDDNFANSAVFKTAVKKSVNAAANVATCSFDTVDLWEVDAGNSELDITVTNLLDGQTGFISVLNKTDEEVTIVGATRAYGNATYVTTLDSIVFQVYNINGEVYYNSLVNVIPAASETNSGILEVATTAEAQALTSDTKIITPSKFADITATESRVGVLEVATTAEAQALTLDTKIITPDKLSDVTAGLICDTISIGSWNMDATSTVAIAHSITSGLSKIMQVNVFVFSDAGGAVNISFPGFSNIGGGWAQWDDTNVTIGRVTSGNFDATGYDDTAINRGWIIIWYIP